MFQDQGSEVRFYAGTEPTVEELMADPIVRMIIKSDRIRTDDAWSAIRAARRRLAVQRWRSAPFAPRHDAAA